MTISYDSAKYYNQEAVIYAIKDKNRFNEQLAYIQKGNLFFYTNKFDSSIAYFLKASVINEQLKSNHYLVQNYSDIAFVYANINKDFLNMARNWLNKAKLKLSNSEDSTKAYFYKTAGVIYLKLDRPNEALTFFLLELKLNNVVDKTGRASLLNNIGLCYLKQNNPDNAQNYFKQSIDSCKKYNLDRVRGITLVNLARSEALKQNYDLSNKIGFEAMPYLIKKTAMPALIENYKLLSKNFLKLNKADSVIKYQKLFYETKDSIFNESIKQQLSSLEKRIEIENKNLQLENSVNLINAAKKQANLYALIASIIGVSFLIILVLGTLLFKRNKLLQSQKGIIQNSLIEKEGLLSEIHHRVKNNLQLVASLIQLQLKSLNDEKSIATIKETNNRINSMLLLHKKLYQNEKISYINTYEYLNTLLPVIIDSYSIKNEIKINNYAQSLKLYLDSAIPVGLIINELVTNSIKYAFENLDDAQININLFIESNELVLMVKDNGHGFSDLELIKKKSFGFKLINSMCRQLDANFEIANNNGAVCTLRIKNYKLYEQS
ncbi:MAG: histidine kinase dimerization/phosphoacceptor domain -containing protein [Bacteroidota bacterium]|nr:histidine kinase dimerization/phosphoacceptor domain -containing protein [Bacteroidota bacterium]